jgi:hypothetical protein
MVVENVNDMTISGSGRRRRRGGTQDDEKDLVTGELRELLQSILVSVVVIVG